MSNKQHNTPRKDTYTCRVTCIHFTFGMYTCRNVCVCVLCCLFDMSTHTKDMRTTLVTRIHVDMSHVKC